jgi:hypothetical protein
VHEGHEMDLKQAGYEASGPGLSSARAHERDHVNMVINRRPLNVFCAIDAFGSLVNTMALSQKKMYYPLPVTRFGR